VNKVEINGKKVAVLFYGTACVGKAMVILVRFVSENWQIEQRVVRLMLLAKSLKGEEVTRQLIMCVYQMN